MALIDRLIKVYGSLDDKKTVPLILISCVRRLLRIVLEVTMPWLLAHERDQSLEKQTEYIVSFTTFPLRINNVWQVVKCMLRQSYRPKKIILWLSLDQFGSKEELPPNLIELESEVFEIRFVDGDIRSHKKYYYAIKEFPESDIILVDDDLYYEGDFIKKIDIAHTEHKNSIICSYGYIINRDCLGKIQKYSTWSHVQDLGFQNDAFFGSGGGTLIRKSYFHNDLLEIETALRLCPLADDIWLNAMAILNKCPLYFVSNSVLLSIKNKCDKPLYAQNIGESMNDKQLTNINNYYFDLINNYIF